MRRKVCIVGAGWAGLSAAHSLAQSRHASIEVYEREAMIGGQASSQKRAKCFVEYSWRVYFSDYRNVRRILRDIGALGNLERLKKVIIATRGVGFSFQNVEGMSLFRVLRKFDVDYWSVAKAYHLFSLPQETLDRDYADTGALDYLGGHAIIKLILGPGLGFEPTKVTVPTVVRLLRTNLGRDLRFGRWLVTSGPPQSSIFAPWKKYLEARGVKFFLDTACTGVVVRDGRVAGLNMEARRRGRGAPRRWTVRADEYVLSASLQSAARITRALGRTPTRAKMRRLQATCLQYYFSVNFYFAEELGPDANYILNSQPWQPIIETKRSAPWKRAIRRSCDRGVVDVWSVDVFDFVPGRKHRRILRHCSLAAAVDETLHQVKTDPYIKGLRSKSGKTFADLYVGHEVHSFWGEKRGRIWTSNPKFSLNAGCAANLVDIAPRDFPPNLWVAAYFCTPARRHGVSTDASCTIGLECAKAIKRGFARSPRRE
uniref:Flavin-containing amine oxidase n=1 Tax=Marseillevirus LCMAC103 TaxID=2506604 RepID=A0A481YVZ4_9VIRU|nr:MAG: flavin-containing amine oxidase [Marseillevirus LCMAC103]